MQVGHSPTGPLHHTHDIKTDILSYPICALNLYNNIIPCPHRGILHIKMKAYTIQLYD